MSETVETINLLVISGSNRGSSCCLDSFSQTIITVGRAPSENIQINDKSISQKHFSLIRSIRNGKDVFLISDNGSKNGTYLNNQRVSDENHEFCMGDILRIGQTEMILISSEKDHSNISKTVVVIPPNPNGIAEDIENFSPFKRERFREVKSGGFLKKSLLLLIPVVLTIASYVFFLLLKT